MLEFIMEYDHVLSAVCDLVCTIIMISSIKRNSTRIEANKHRIEDIETIICKRTGERKKKK